MKFAIEVKHSWNAAVTAASLSGLTKGLYIVAPVMAEHRLFA